MNPKSHTVDAAIEPISIKSVKPQIDAALTRLMQQRQAEAEAIGGPYVKLWQTIEAVSMAGGKRIRPYLTVVGNGDLDEDIVPVALAQELIHIAMLMHDDIIDQDYVRHGQDNVGGIYKKTYDKHLDSTRSTHYANGAALLAGDALIAESYRLIYSSNFDSQTQQRLLSQLSQSIFDVIGGELLDVELGFVNDLDVSPIQVYRYKTASYSFVGPIVSGAIASAADDATTEALHDFAVSAGVAYQIQDDLLGVFGDESSTGKSTLTDLREGKQTLLIEYYQSLMSDDQAVRFAESFGKDDASDEELNQIKLDIDNSGARAKTATMANLYFDQAVEHLSKLEDGTRKSGLDKFIKALRERNS